MVKKTRRLVPLFALGSFLSVPVPVYAQLGDFLDQVKTSVDQTGAMFDDAKAVRCDVQGACGQVVQADHFDPGSYESLAVTVFDGTGQYNMQGVEGMVRDVFESQLVENGFLLAASSDAATVREKIARSEGSWTDDDLKQLADFVEGIDAVLVVEIRQLNVGTCQSGERYGTEATAQLSARWLNADVGDVPWVGTHSAAVCRDHGSSVPSEALDKTAKQLASVLPAR